MGRRAGVKAHKKPTGNCTTVGARSRAEACFHLFPDLEEEESRKYTAEAGLNDLLEQQ